MKVVSYKKSNQIAAVSYRNEDEIKTLLNNIILDKQIADLNMEQILTKYKVSSTKFYEYLADERFADYRLRYKNANTVALQLDNKEILLRAKLALQRKLDGDTTSNITKEYKFIRGKKVLIKETERITKNNTPDLQTLKLVIDRLSESMSSENIGEMSLKVFMKFNKFLSVTNPTFLTQLIEVQNQYLSVIIDNQEFISVDAEDVTNK